jgi:hypothetical protein
MGGFYMPDSNWTWKDTALSALAALLLVACFAIFGAYHEGNFQGRLSEWMAEKETCLKTEKRQFADVGFWFIPGSGEITMRTVCVQWLVNR